MDNKNVYTTVHKPCILSPSKKATSGKYRIYNRKLQTDFRRIICDRIFTQEFSRIFRECGKHEILVHLKIIHKYKEKL